MKSTLCLFVLTTLLCTKLFAQQITPPAQQQEYYTFSENQTTSDVQLSFQSPLQMFQDTMSTAKTAMSLLNWILHPEEMPVPTEKYQRVLQFGRWINDPTDDTCLNTRAKVLVRDSEATVTFRNNKNCVVDTGFWKDPYAGAELKESKQIQIDHVVPLKHAYVSGAWKWDFKTRCLFANFLGADFHLLSVSGHENMSKGDRSPDAYVPPEENYRCEYLETWLKIKAVWKLSIGKSEAAAIQNIIRNQNCDLTHFKLSAEELNKYRNYIQDNLNYCALNQR